MNRISRFAVLACLVCLSPVFAGCSKSSIPSPGTIQDARRHMNILSAVYSEYLRAHNETPPKSADEFRKYCESQPDLLKLWGATSFDDMMTSKRDGKQFVIVTGKRRAPANSPETPWAAYEETGVDGTQMAVAVRGGARELMPDEISREFGAK